MENESVNARKSPGFLRVLRFPPTGNADRVGWGYPLTLEKILKIHRMEIVWTFKVHTHRTRFDNATRFFDFH